MCHERYLRRRGETDDRWEMWRDFARTQPVDDHQPPDEVTEPEPIEEREAIATAER